ncbi:SusD/RagB family nutrient-binding outer membrane lipoprotein [Chitinophaga sp. SYP-B3965]|uniref:SusD/RagB family nutrient-binding outer membrane lipoprotein n=1 Tax=Chitinophaga sp. SYP-B3965 TaxID=2663120 RepID=UPI001299DAC5|nr:SusD/RagB family nutrient-binding outer membrane lipoprotein [Chitinophaga sp. SYP-B3965]MRG43762.1 SusD/RagB family nutrient-binding outer membrane lipoprotein [Chitinophaga sp. SYP-B3965]
MKKLSIYIFISVTVLFAHSCTKDFAEINSDPSLVPNPDVNTLFAYSLDNLETYQGTEWVWENLEQLLRFSQHMTTDPYELSTNINSRYGVYYNNILPNLFEIRRLIELRADKGRYRNIRAATHIVQVLHGLKVTDMNGSIPYTQAIKGRTEQSFTPVYDDQKTLYDTWLKELTDAVDSLSGTAADQVNFGSSDFFYKNNWSSWAKLANTLKLRIAVRYERQDVNIAKQAFKEVMQNTIGPIDDASQFVYNRPEHNPIGNDIDYRSPRFATSSIMTFLKATNDPRLPIYFTPNDLTGSFRDTLTKYNKTLPAFINLNDPLVMFQGGPADWTTDPVNAAFYKTAFEASQWSKYRLYSNINKKFFAPRYNNFKDGQMLDYMVTRAETCFYIAEFIQKGYGVGFDTKGTAEEWYNRGIESSIRTMDAIAIAAVSTPGLTGNGNADIAAYQNNVNVKFNGVNNLERIYIQQYLNFYRLGNEAFTFCRRTGYPKNTSTYYRRNTWNEPIPRRYSVNEPPLGTNTANWTKSQQDQGFTPGDRSIPSLSTQRLWFDKTSPNFGEGN